MNGNEEGRVENDVNWLTQSSVTTQVDKTSLLYSMTVTESSYIFFFEKIMKF